MGRPKIYNEPVVISGKTERWIKDWVRSSGYSVHEILLAGIRQMKKTTLSYREFRLEELDEELRRIEFEAKQRIEELKAERAALMTEADRVKEMVKSLLERFARTAGINTIEGIDGIKEYVSKRAELTGDEPVQFFRQLDIDVTWSEFYHLLQEGL